MEISVDSSCFVRNCEYYYKKEKVLDPEILCSRSGAIESNINNNNINDNDSVLVC